MIKAWDKTDNSAAHAKAQLRIKYLPPKAKVLDLFCGTGQMYNLAYKDRVTDYHGVDKEKIHNPDICTLANNITYIQENDISQYNVFDLNDYGCPWKQLYLILKKHKGKNVTLYVTDGLVMHMKVDGKVTKFISATERIRKNANIPGLNRWYTDIFATMLLDIEARYGWHTEKAMYFHNERRSVYYWCLKMIKL